MQSDEQSRWLDLLSYIHALIYHQRSETEQPKLHEAVQQSAKSAKHKEEVREMVQTYAEVLRAEGRKAGHKAGERKGHIIGLQHALLNQLRERFGEVSEQIEHRIAATEETEQLNAWLKRILTAKKLSDMKFE